MKFTHEFVEYIPETVEERKIYVSIPFGTVIHKCACGCGEEVVTPLGPAEWRLTYDGASISLYPSIGNWGFACRSHYWLENSEILWSRAFSSAEVAEVRKQNRANRRRYYRNALNRGQDQNKRMTTGLRLRDRLVAIWRRFRSALAQISISN